MAKNLEKKEIAAEKERIAAEKKRIAVEKKRIVAEKKRIVAEKKRIVAEKKKIVTEKKKNKTQKKNTSISSSRQKYLNNISEKLLGHNTFHKTKNNTPVLNTGKKRKRCPNGTRKNKEGVCKKYN